MGSHVRLSFIEKEFFTGNRTHDNMRGIEKVVAKINDRAVVTNTLDAERMMHAEFTDTLLFRLDLEVPCVDIDLTQHLNATEDGQKWLESSRGLYEHLFEPGLFPDVLGRTYRSLKFSAKTEPFPTLASTAFPDDYGGVGPHSVSRFQPPRVIIHSMPQTAQYLELKLKKEVVMQKKGGSEDIQYVTLGADGQIRHTNGSIWTPHINDLSHSDPHRRARGLILGQIQQGDFRHVSGDPEIGFPHKYIAIFQSYIQFGDTSHNPTSIQVELT